MRGGESGLTQHRMSSKKCKATSLWKDGMEWEDAVVHAARWSQQAWREDDLESVEIEQEVVRPSRSRSRASRRRRTRTRSRSRRRHRRGLAKSSCQPSEPPQPVNRAQSLPAKLIAPHTYRTCRAPHRDASASHVCHMVTTVGWASHSVGDTMGKRWMSVG